MKRESSVMQREICTTLVLVRARCVRLLVTALKFTRTVSLQKIRARIVKAFDRSTLTRV